jgi:hypothetical protein
MVRVLRGESLSVNALAPAHKPEKVEIRCAEATSMREMIIVLHPIN